MKEYFSFVYYIEAPLEQSLGHNGLHGSNCIDIQHEATEEDINLPLFEILSVNTNK